MGGTALQGARTCLRLHKKLLQGRKVHPDPREMHKHETALSNALGFAILFYASQFPHLGPSLCILKVGSPYGCKGVIPARDRSPAGMNCPANVQNGHKRPKRSFLTRGWGAEPLQTEF